MISRSGARLKWRMSRPANILNGRLHGLLHGLTRGRAAINADRFGAWLCGTRGRRMGEFEALPGCTDEDAS